MPARDTILLFADTGAGKTAQVGELARYLRRVEGKKTRLYSGDPGGARTVQPQINVGTIVYVPVFHLDDPFDWLEQISRGRLPREDGRGWRDQTAEEAAETGLYAYEGFTGFGDLCMQNLAGLAARGQNIGGGASVTFKQGQTQIGSNNQAHFGIVQNALTRAAFQSFRLSNPEAAGVQDEPYVIWTAAARRANDGDTNSPILGPQIVGKALTSEVPRWFIYTFHLVCLPADDFAKTPEEHRLYFGAHTDQTAPGSKAMGNNRTPMGVDPLPPYISPADLPKALDMIRGKMAEAEAAQRAELALLEGRQA